MSAVELQFMPCVSVKGGKLATVVARTLLCATFPILSTLLQKTFYLR